MALPLLGVFDYDYFELLHKAIAGTFFITASFHYTTITMLLKKYQSRHAFTQSQLYMIEVCYKFAFFCTIAVCLFLFCFLFIGSEHWTSAILEWTCVLSYMTLTILINTVNPYQDGFELNIGMPSI